jgi:hypothetical protein
MRRGLLATVIVALAGASVASATDEPALQATHDVLLAAATVPSHPTNDLRFAAIPGSSLDDVVLGAFPLRPEDFESALPPPPQKVTLENSYAPVVFSHAGHLSRRTACKACHGEGPVRKIGRFQPKVAHDTCRACHVTAAKGPTDCRGCHVVKPKIDEAELARSEPSDPRRTADLAARANANLLPISVAMLTPGAALPLDTRTAAGAFETAASWPVAPATPVTVELERSPEAAPAALSPQSRRSVLAGASMVAAQGTPTAAAAALQVTMQQDGFQLTESLEWAGSPGARRTLGLVAGGIVRPLRPRWSAHVLGVGGFDAINVGWTAFLPAIGARAGVEWATSRPFAHCFDLSITALTDVMRVRDPRGASMGGALVSVSLSAGIDVLGGKR